MSDDIRKWYQEEIFRRIAAVKVRRGRWFAKLMAELNRELARKLSGK